MIPFPDNPRYLVSTTGEIYSQYTKKKLKVWVENGYYRTGLLFSGKQKFIYVHQVVALTYLSNPKNLPQVDHIDGNKLNNDVRNLEWVSVSENGKRSFSLGLSKRTPGSLHHGALLDEEKVLEIRKLLDERKLSQYGIAKLYGVSRSCILNIHLGKAWKHI